MLYLFHIYSLSSIRMDPQEEENLQLAPRVPPLPRRQNAVQVGVAEVVAPHVPPLLRRQNAVLGAVAGVRAVV